MRKAGLPGAPPNVLVERHPLDELLGMGACRMTGLSDERAKELIEALDKKKSGSETLFVALALAVLTFTAQIYHFIFGGGAC